MPEDSSTWLVEDKIPQSLVGRDRGLLLPESLPGRRRNATDNNIADLALGVAADNVDGPGATRRRNRPSKLYDYLLGP